MILEIPRILMEIKFKHCLPGARLLLGGIEVR